MSDTLPTGQLSNVPWRRTGVKYTNNEAYFDVVEEIDVIIDKSGSTVFAEIQGYVCYFFIMCSCEFFCIGHYICSKVTFDGVLYSE
jgi:Adaptor complexes medium subunit family